MLESKILKYFESIKPIYNSDFKVEYCQRCGRLLNCILNDTRRLPRFYVKREIELPVFIYKGFRICEECIMDKEFGYVSDYDIERLTEEERKYLIENYGVRTTEQDSGRIDEEEPVSSNGPEE